MTTFATFHIAILIGILVYLNVSMFSMIMIIIIIYWSEHQIGTRVNLSFFYLLRNCFFEQCGWVTAMPLFQDDRILFPDDIPNAGGSMVEEKV